MKIFIIICIIFAGIMLVFDYGRFSSVSNAKTQEELIKACQNYSMSTIKDMPARCLEVFNITK